jgi:hypothetical protein
VAKEDELRLLRGLREHEPWAAAVLVDRHLDHVRRVLVRVMGARDPEFDDLVQDRPSWRADPFVGATAGLQFLLAYVDHSEQAITDVYRVASLALDAQMGVRLLLRRETWLVLQVSGGRAVSLATQARVMTDSLADTWAVRTAVGLLMAL